MLRDAGAFIFQIVDRRSRSKTWSWRSIGGKIWFLCSLFESPLCWLFNTCSLNLLNVDRGEICYPGEATCIFQRYQLGHTCPAEGVHKSQYWLSWCLLHCLGLNHFYYDFIQAAFVPTSESAIDTSYFTSRYSWNTSDDLVYPPSELEDSSDADSLSGSSSCLSNRHDEVVF